MMERLVTVVCRSCGCQDESVIEAGVPLPLASRAWGVLVGDTTMLRFGGCHVGCRCHDPSLGQLWAVVSVGPTRSGTLVPPRPAGYERA